ncbi:MAG: hypothetical protein GX328_06110 [Clostridiaceae bacterium]|nr:hypothetical protein [Clostridiaceae bacterium]
MQEKMTKNSLNGELFKNILIIVMIISMFIPAISFVFGLDSPNYSKEPLRPFPEKKLNSETGAQFDDWWNDHFPFRSILVTAYNGLLDHVFQTSGNQRVIVGKSGMYYFEPTLRQYLNAPDLSDYDIARIAESLNLQEEYLLSQGIKLGVFIIPNKATIYPEFMPDRFKPLDNTSDLDRLQIMYPSMVDMKQILLDAKENEDLPIYHQEDSHWTKLGAYYGYNALMDYFSLEDQIIKYQKPLLTDGWQGDLSNMLYPAIEVNDNQVIFEDYEQNFVYTRPLRTYEDVEIESRCEQQKSLLMFRDSFANAWIDLVSNSFGVVHYSRSLPYRYDLVEQIKPDYVAIELIERNMDYLLQTSPDILAKKLEVSEVAEFSKATSADKLQIDMETTTTNNLVFFNAKYFDQSLGKKITSVRIKFDSGVYKALPVYQDDDLTDKTWEYGFSLYLEETETDNLPRAIFYMIDDVWYQADLDLVD